MDYCPKCNNILDISKLPPKTSNNITNDNIIDQTVSAYKICKHCSYYMQLTSETEILSKRYLNDNTFSDVNNTMYSNKRYDRTLPHTRIYNCKNNLCETHKNNKLKDAVWFRTDDKNSYTTFLCCVQCGTYWKL